MEEKDIIEEKIEEPGGATADNAALEKRLAELTSALEEAKAKKILPAEPQKLLWKRITGAVIWTVLCAVFVLLLIITLAAAIAKTKGDRIEILGFSMYIVLTGSMEPEIKVGDIIISRKVPQNSIKVGDDITFQQGDLVITHRVIEVTGKGYITKGLANSNADGEILYTSVYGKVVFRSTVIGAVYKFVESQYGFLFVIVVPLFLFVIYETWALTKKFKALKSAGDGDDDEENKENDAGKK